MKEYDLVVATGDIVVRKGAVGELEHNRVHAYLGEWVTFTYPIADTEQSFEVRFPLEFVLEHDMVRGVEKEDYTDGD